MASSSGKCTIDIPSAGNCNCYLITLQISYLNLSLSIYIYFSPSLHFFVSLSIQLRMHHCLSPRYAAVRVCSVDVTPTCIKGVRKRERERDVSRSARCSIDTKSIINESTGRNDIADARVLDPSGPVCSC